MAIEIREFVGAEALFFNNVESAKTGPLNLTEWHADEMIDPNSIMVDIEGIHSIITRNNTYYTPECLRESIPHWTNPYGTPVIMHHKEKDGITIGRVKAVEFTDKQTRSGTPALIFTVNIPDEEGKKAIKNGTLSTVSIGAIAHDVRCSICGTNLAEHGLCEHEKGEMYEDKLCYWIINKIEPKELSYVIVPSDKYAHNLRVYKPQLKAKVVGESTNQSEVTKRMFENPFADIQVVEATQEGEITIAEAKEKEEVQPKQEEKPKESKKEEEVKEVPKEEPKKEDETPNEVNVDEEVKGEEEGEVKEEVVKEEPKKEEPKEETKEETPEENKELKELKTEVEELKAQIKDLHKKLEAEKNLRESAETELLGFRLEKKKVLVEKVNSLRTELNLEQEDANTLMESSEETLELTIKNLNEFTNVAKNILNIPKVNSTVSVSEEADNTSKENKPKEVKESNEDSNIDLMEEVLNIFNNVW